MYKAILLLFSITILSTCFHGCGSNGMLLLRICRIFSRAA